MISAFTVDVEDYFQVSGFETNVARESWNFYESRVVGNTQRLLELMAAYQVRGTFFILGWVAARHRRLIQQIHQEGHELGSHSYWHQLVYTQTPTQYREDLRRSKDVLEEITGAPVRAYRAPSFSITQRSMWALEILVEEGFKLDSSIFPVLRSRYGIPDARRGPHRLQTPSGDLWEFPPTVARNAKWNLPVGGGGYFRLFPIVWTNYWMSRVQQRERQPGMFYIHPWEIDPNQPRIKTSNYADRFRHYVNLSRTERKLRCLLSRFKFATLSDALSAHHSQLALAKAA